MAVYAVDKVSQEVSFINGAGDVKKAHLFEWVNYPLSDATWQTHGHGNLSIVRAMERRTQGAAAVVNVSMFSSFNTTLVSYLGPGRCHGSAP